MSQTSQSMLTKEDGTPDLEKAPEDPSKNVSMNAPRGAEPVAVDQLLARLECEPAADKKEGFLKEHMNNLPTPERKGLSLENAVALSGLLRDYSVNGFQEVSDKLKDAAIGMLQLIEDPAWNEQSPSDIMRQTREVQQWCEDHPGSETVDTKYGKQLSLRWSDEETCQLVLAADMYGRYKPQFLALSLNKLSLYVGNYLHIMTRIKIIASVQSDCITSNSTGKQGKRIRAPSAKQRSAAAVVSKGAKGKPGGRAPKDFEAALRDNSEPGKKRGPKAQGGHPQNVMDSTVEWLRLGRDIDANPHKYYRDLCTMWTSGENGWTGQYPIPSQSQVYYWLRNSRRARPAVVDKKKAHTKKQNKILRNKAMEKHLHRMAARQHDYERYSNRQLALSKSIDPVLSLLEQNDSGHMAILLLAQISKSFNYRVVNTEVYSQVKRRLQGRFIDIDALLVLKQLEFSPSKPNSSSGMAEAEIVKRPSTIQIHVDFSALPVSAQSNALKGFKADFKDTIVNLGDALNAERLIFIGEGGFGSVFALPEQRLAIKVFKRPAPLEQVIRDVANESACFHLASTLKRMSMSARGAAHQNRFLPFTPLPSVEMAGSTSGAIALPSWGLGDGLYYPALIMDLAACSINLESRDLSKKFFSDPMGLVSEEGFIRLASLMRLIAEPLAAMHSLNVSHRDLKEDNVLALRVAPGIDGYIHYNTHGKKMTGRLGDCGKALCFGVEFYVETEGPTTVAGAAAGKASKRARNAMEAVSKVLVNCPPKPLALGEQLQPMAGMESKTGTVPKVIPVRAIHLLNPVAPSTEKKGDPSTIRRKAPLYSGTITYTPPEIMPPLPSGVQFLTARDYQAGDMWSLGVVLANVLGGSGLRLSMLGSHDKMIFAQAEDRVIWTKLNKLSTALKEGGRVPDEWSDAMDLLRSLTRHDPQERMTAAEVLQHPFLKRAEMLPRLYSS